ncbi:hypothetical protein [Rummeliibacillus pycnus]|uniref:hypothetical protein n=1 Tax=Rummeliibacillus pycnus TaxID=101070 RepID=UPI003D29AAB4
MPRINLPIEDELFKHLELQAKKHKISVNNEIINILESVFFEEPFDFDLALNKLIKETESLPEGKEFVLNQLESYSNISMGKVDSNSRLIKPSINRRELGKRFNKAVRNNDIPHVKRAKNENGEDIRWYDTSVYIIKKTDCGTTQVENNQI